MNRYVLIYLKMVIETACDADYQRLADGSGNSARLTIAQALEVLK